MSALAKNILFVGAQVVTQPRLRESLRLLNPAWTPAFSGVGKDALGLLEQGSFDAVVADDALPDMDGVDFLNAVQARHPASRRFILANLADGRSAAKSVRTTHICVPKPWDSDTLQTVLERAFSL